MSDPELELDSDAAAIRKIMFDNDEILEMYFTMLAGGEFWDGGTYRLFFVPDTRAVVYNKAKPGAAPPDCMGGRARLIYQVHEHRDVAAEILFDTDNDCMSLENFGYREWQKEIAAAIGKALRQPGR